MGYEKWKARLTLDVAFQLHGADADQAQHAEAHVRAMLDRMADREKVDIINLHVETELDGNPNNKRFG